MLARAFVELVSYVENAVDDGMFCFSFHRCDCILLVSVKKLTKFASSRAFYQCSRTKYWKQCNTCF